MTYKDIPNINRLKKSLGQHLLIDNNVLDDIGSEFLKLYNDNDIIEVGPGRGALTDYIIDNTNQKYSVIEKDDEFVKYLKEKYGSKLDTIYHCDVLEFDLSEFDTQELFVLGNYPYNISTQIIFWILNYRDKISLSMGMFQKEVARRIASSHGTKEYGILSVLSQAYYEVEYCFDISPEAFDPPPKVWSGIITMKRLKEEKAEFSNLKKVVKLAFNQRRKMLRNSLKSIEWTDDTLYRELMTMRPEQITVDQFCELSKMAK